MEEEPRRHGGSDEVSDREWASECFRDDEMEYVAGGSISATETHERDAHAHLLKDGGKSNAPKTDRTTGKNELDLSKTTSAGLDRAISTSLDLSAMATKDIAGAAEEQSFGLDSSVPASRRRIISKVAGQTNTFVQIPEKLLPTVPASAGDGDAAPGESTGTALSAAGRARPETIPASGPSVDSSGITVFTSRGATVHSSVSIEARDPGGENIFTGRQDTRQPHADNTPGATAVPGSMMGESNETQSENNLQESRSHILFHAELVDGEDSPGQMGQGGQSNMPPHMSPSPNEPVYDGIAMRSREKSTLWGTISRRKKYIVSVAVICCIAAAITTPLALNNARRTRSNAAEGGDPPLRPSARPTSKPSSSPTSEPSALPTSERFQSFKAVILSAAEHASISSTSDALEDNETPQHRAMMWLLNIDKQTVGVLDEKNIVQRFALATFYFSTGGDEGWWWQKPKFLSDASVCTWKTKSERFGSDSFCVRGKTSEIRAACSGDSETLDTFIIGEVCLEGTLPAELGLLTGLRHLQMAKNGLYGHIPPSLGNLARLEVLDLSENWLSSTVPAMLGQLSKLVKLDLSGNEISGPLPAELSNLGQLEVMNLARMLIGGTLPFTPGSLPSLRTLQLSENQLTGSIPRALFTFTNLELLYLDNNILSGPLHSEVGNLVNLRDMYIGSNKLRGVPPWKGKTKRSRRYLGITNLSNLQFLGLGQNLFSGELPSSIGAMTNLELLWLHKNRFRGGLPVSLGALTNLGYLLLSKNKLSGAVPDIFGGMTYLWGLFLDANNFVGRIPPSLADLEYLGQLSIANTSLTGDMNFFCEATGSEAGLGIADCHGNDPQVSCDCCQVCCSDYERSGDLTVSDLGADFVAIFGEGDLPGCSQVSPFPWEP